MTELYFVWAGDEGWRRSTLEEVREGGRIWVRLSFPIRPALEWAVVLYAGLWPVPDPEDLEAKVKAELAELVEPREEGGQPWDELHCTM